ncbi:molybdopterin-guanine dinucleotide biosynthesis protein B [Halonatronum saccharophilum]|uniref:molybdopterin-guanine dinucleotide biosynthesis protein B n=1 Tax=Halonatronum saccharophilum TaxID=150060 RepID=UPI000480CCCA|nr:molybdopterin-guanine dinucleotide biosynthesis protein B [Halonatronum saccharophilum]
MIPIVSIVGWTNSGKTTFMTKLITEMKGRGYRVGTIKHNAHRVVVDKPGKDSWRHKKAGAEEVIISSADRLIMIKDVEEEPSVAEVVDGYMSSDLDLILVEGDKEGDHPKIEIFRPSSYDEPIFNSNEVLAQIINKEPNLTEVLFSKEVKAVANIIEEDILKFNHR